MTERVALCGVMGEEGDGPCQLHEGHPGLHSDGDARYATPARKFKRERGYTTDAEGRPHDVYSGELLDL